MAKDQTLYCSFCGKSQHEVKKLIAGPSVFICDECTGLCADILREDVFGKIRSSAESTPTVNDFHKALNFHINGHNAAKCAFAVFLHRHYVRMASVANQAESAALPNNLVLIGSSLTRSRVMQSLMQCVDRPVAVVDAKMLARLEKSQDSAQAVAEGLLDGAAHHIGSAETGIVYLDDFDQLCGPAKRPAATAAEIQREISRLVSGVIIDVTNLFGPSRQRGILGVSTNGLSFIFGGRFLGVPDLGDHQGWITGQTWDEFPEKSGAMAGLLGLTDPGAKALIDFGMMPEIVRRIAAVVELQADDRANPAR